MKKILLYTDTPQRGGAELQMFLLAKFLDKTKFEPILICSKYKELDKWCTNFEKERIKVYRLNVKSKHDPRHYFKLKKIIKEEQPDILHAHIWNPASCRYAYIVAKSTKIPLIITEHDPFELSPFKDFFKKKALKFVTKIVAISNNNKTLLSKLYPDHKQKITVIHNGLDLTWWQSQLLRFPDEDLHKIKKDLFHCKENTLVITTVAELNDRKGIKYLINAIPVIIKKYPNTKFVIIGDGPHRKNYENLIKKLKIENHIILLGRQKEIPKLLKSSNIFLLPSIREGFGMVNLEAMITPLPIIATLAGGIPEVVKDGKTGILVETENTNELIKALNKLIPSSSLREKYAIAGHDRVLKKFDAREMTIAYGKLYEDIKIAQKAL
ncbi:MAG: glycosyltransferase family 4 protein [Candidatus Gracilibacteria bacterium]|nr:glycosyltransferase family 4 protein [Candidatus Gracilibacteria bacterium]